MDTSCSARKKLHNIDKEQRKTGGGSAHPLSKVESLAIDSVAGTTVRGIPGGSTLQLYHVLAVLLQPAEV